MGLQDVQVAVNQREGTLKQPGAEVWELVAADFGPYSTVHCVLKRPLAEGVS